MTKRPLCIGTLKDGSACRSVAVRDGYCAHHAKLQAGAVALTRDELATEPEPFEPASELDEPAAPAADPAKPKRTVVDIRSALRADAAEQYDKIQAFFDDALEATRDVRGKCATCGAGVSVAAPDWSSRVNALRLLIEAGYGKPPADEKRVAQTAELDGITWPDVRKLSHHELQLLQTKILLERPEFIEQLVADVEHVRALVEEHGDDAVGNLVRAAAESQAERLRQVATAVAPFA